MNLRPRSFFHAVQVAFLVTITSTIGVVSAVAQTGGAPACDVRDVEIEPATGVETPEERVKRLERALYESLSAYDECQTVMSSSSAGSGSAGGTSMASGSAEGTGSESNNAADSGEGSDQASSVAARSQDQQEMRDMDEASIIRIEDREGSGGFTNEVALDNGAIPKDIPPGDDDDIVAQQIREAAMRETDPEIRERLWADYRKYKGLPAR